MTPPGAADGVDPVLQRLFSRRPEHPERHLRRITALCASLGDPQHAFPAISITGTNGKTSVARMVTALLVAHGLHVGTYTSPHLQDVRERICLDGMPVPRADFDEVLADLEPHVAAVEAAQQTLVTFFEVLTAVACRLFAVRGVDAAVLEVGKGGRVDATSVADGRVAVFNPIALEHPELGPTVAAVASEKAGLLKPGAVAVSARQSPAAAAVLARAAADRGAPLLTAGRDFDVVARSTDPQGQQLVLATAAGGRWPIRLPLHGAHQADNAACALAAVEAFLGPDALDEGAVASGFAAVRAPGRLEVLSIPGQPPVVLDGAHNPAAARALAAALRDELPGGRRVLVLGVFADKDVEALVSELLPVADVVVVTQPPGPRVVSLERLAAAAAGHGNVHPAADVGEALEVARGEAGPTGVVVVTGSLYTVGAARDILATAAAHRSPAVATS